MKLDQTEPEGDFILNLMACTGKQNIQRSKRGEKEGFISQIRLCVSCRCQPPILTCLLDTQVDKEKDSDFLKVHSEPSSGAHLCGLLRVCVFVFARRQSLASQVIRETACLSLSLQPENTLLFRTARTAPLPLPHGLLLSTSEKRKPQKEKLQKKNKKKTLTDNIPSRRKSYKASKATPLQRSFV